jgi:tetratricopeptide (TPR) repeat protein
LNPEYADGIYNKGDILVCLNRIPEAIEVMSIAIKKRPNWPLYYCNRGKQYIALGKQKEALDDLNLAYANSKDLVPSAQLTAGNITYIKNTLSNEREKLL